MTPEMMAQMPSWFLMILILGGIVFIGTLFSIVIYLLKELKRNFEKDIETEKREREKLSSSCSLCRENLPKVYVLRDDFIREIALLGRKIELVFNEVKDSRGEIQELRTALVDAFKVQIPVKVDIKKESQ